MNKVRKNKVGGISRNQCILELLAESTKERGRKMNDKIFHMDEVDKTTSDDGSVTATEYSLSITCCGCGKKSKRVIFCLEDIDQKAGFHCEKCAPKVFEYVLREREKEGRE